MYPDLFGINNFSYTLMMIIGFIVAFAITFIYLKKKSKFNMLDFTIIVLITLAIGIITAILFENIYEAIKHAINGENQKFTWAMTFIGGLLGGAVAFLLLHRFYYMKNNESILIPILKIVPSSICFAHACGRLGCFLAGCCYGKQTSSWIGMSFPSIPGKVIPTQLIEMIFLLILGGVLLFLAIKDYKYELPIYLIGYGIFRFIIEFYRGDERGQIGLLSPSQYFCILFVAIAPILIFSFRGFLFKESK
ncbi:MAG: prolipoprotein diacylglyceryl transferase [Bacilli bacterium]|nr:prolipoprotein diacylglyceryl transferase [Bacilli bacterium]